MHAGGDDTSSRSRRLAWILRFGAGALAIFVGANVAVVVADRRLPEPRRYLSPRTEQLVGEMDRLRDAGVRKDVLFVGTSQAARGIIPKVVGEQLGLKTGNVAIPGSQAPVTKRWVLEEVEPRLHPRCVVWGLSSIDLNGARPDPSLPRYDAALATRQGLLGEADEELADALPIARHRSQLRDPYKLGHELGTDEPATRPARPLGQLLGPVVRAPATEQGKLTEAVFLERTLLAHFRMTPTYRNALRSTIAELGRRDVTPVVVIMPVSSTYIASHPRGAPQYEAWKRAATRVAEDAGAKVIDLDSSMPDSAFSDYVHLKHDAAMQWSATLARELSNIDCGGRP